jgi:hypothetical protein
MVPRFLGGHVATVCGMARCAWANKSLRIAQKCQHCGAPLVDRSAGIAAPLPPEADRVRTRPPTKRRLASGPGIPAVTVAIRLLHQLRRQYPQDQSAELWKRVYPAVILGYGSMSAIEQKTVREQLRERVRWRRRHLLDKLER